MKITDLQKQVENLPEKLRKPILAIIEIKTDSDMDRVLSKIEHFESKLENFQSSVTFKINAIIWILGILFTLILAIAGFTIFK